MVERAVLTGDRLQAKAASAIALERGDTQAVDVYLASAPDHEGAAYVEYVTSVNRTMQDGLSRAVAFSSVQ